MRASGPDIGLAGTTDNRGTPRSPAGLHGTSRNIKKVRFRTQIHFFFARFPHFRLLVFFSPLPFSQHLLLRQMEGLSKPPTCYALGDGEGWGKRPRMEECRRNVLASGPDSGANGTTSNRGTPRNPAEPSGTSRNTKKGYYAPENTLFCAIPTSSPSRCPLSSTPPLPILLHLPAPSMSVVSKGLPFVATSGVGRGRRGEKKTRRRRCGKRAKKKADRSA